MLKYVKMDYVLFLKTVKENGMELFTLHDLEILFPKTKQKTIKNNLTNWLEKGYVARLRRNLYECVEYGEERHMPDFYLANKLYSPSYVSLEAALSFYNMIPEEAAEVTSVTTKATRIIRNKYGVFSYRTCKKNAFVGYKIMKIQGYKVLFADREKALVDFLYYQLNNIKNFDFKEERFNEREISKLNRRKIREYAKKFNKKTFEAVKKLI